jgi:eukaryotic-like serine/threonine-protein kinase
MPPERVSSHDQGSPEDLSSAPTQTFAFPDPDFAPPVTDQMIGQRIGHYELVQEIGHGGMGTVYRAIRADDEFQAEVAIKIVNRGMDSRLVLNRFRNERQIQARLEHPHIVRLLDGGTTDKGLPYFVMEHIQGQPLTKYCDVHQLPVSERLILFRKVCDAVSYAHQNLIIHRDLKPDNILVTAEGIPKLLDFGIAKILELPVSGDTSEPTMTMMCMGTPAYSSPEQIRGAHIGVATDIYSLGVILYELLTGRRPYRLDSLGWEESARVICERDATRPSAVVSSKSDAAAETEQISHRRGTTADGLRKCLTGDLDNIISVALRKEPDRRYKSVDQFSEELQRHLDGRPVMARGDSVAYVAGKFIGRHKLAVATVALSTVLLCVASIVAILQARRLSVRVDEDRRLASSFLVDIHDEIAKLPGATPAREALLTKSVDYLNGLARETGGNEEMRRSLAMAYERFAELLAGVDSAGLGKSAQALKTYQTSKRIRETLAREAPGDPNAQYDLAANYLIGSYITGRASSVEQRLAYDRKALEISEALVKGDSKNSKYQALLAKAYTSTAYGYGIYGRWSEANVYFRKAVPIRERLAAEQPDNREAQRELANIHYRIGVIETQAGRPRQSLPDLEEALRIQTRLLNPDTHDQQIRSDVASTHHFLGVSLGAVGDFNLALSHFKEAIRIREATLAADDRDARTRSLLAGNYAEQSTVLLNAGRQRDALTSIRRAVDLQQQMFEVDAKGVPVRLSLADYQARLGGVYAALKEWHNAAQSWTHAVALYDELDREGHLRASEVRRDAERSRVEAARCTALAGGNG